VKSLSGNPLVVRYKKKKTKATETIKGEVYSFNSLLEQL